MRIFFIFRMALAAAMAAVVVLPAAVLPQSAAAAEVEFAGVTAEAEDVGYNPRRAQDGGPFQALYQVGGHFIAAGSCIAAPTSGHERGDGGLYLVSAEGQVLDSSNVCNEDEGRLAALGEQSLDPGIHVYPAGGNRFVVSGAFGHPPRFYEISGNSLSFVDRVYDPTTAYLNGDGIRSSGANSPLRGAVAGGYYFEAMEDGGGKNGMAVFRLPSFDLADFLESVGDSDVQPQPIIGIGSHLLIERTESERLGGRTRSVNYADVFTVSSDGELSFMQTLGRFRTLAVSSDAASSSRFALLTADPALRYEGGTNSPDFELKIYSADASGVTLESSTARNDMRNVLDPISRFGFSGSMLAYRNSSGDLQVRDGGSSYEVESEGAMWGAAASSGGNVLVSMSQGMRLGVFSDDEIIVPDSGFPPSGPDGGGAPPASIPGQLLEITYPAGKTSPDILIRFATLNSVTQGNMNISIYDQPFAVNTQNAQFLRFDWTPASPSEFVPGGFVNVFGSLDTEAGANIAAVNVRNPLPFAPAPSGGGSPQAAPNNNVAAPVTTPPPAPAPTAPSSVSPSSQNSLNSLQRILLELQQRFAQ